MAIFLKTPLILIGNDDLARVSRDNPGYRFEREADGTIIVSPTHTKGGVKSLEAAVQLYSYAKAAGGKAYDSSTGFAIGPGERVYSPDAAWVSQPRIDAIKATGDAGFLAAEPRRYHCKSDTDIFADTVAKIERFIERGSSYATAIGPANARRRRARRCAGRSRP